MNILTEKQNLVYWIQTLKDESVLAKIIDLKVESEISDFENQLIQKGLIDITNGNTSTHEEVKRRFESNFANK